MVKETIEKYIDSIMSGINSSVDFSGVELSVDQQKLVQNLAFVIKDIYMNGFRDGIDKAKEVLK